MVKKKRSYRADGTRMITAESTANPKLGAKLLADGRESLFLDYYEGCVDATSRSGKTYKKARHRRETLGIYLDRPSTPTDTDKEKLRVAQRIQYDRGAELLEREKGYTVQKRTEVDFLTYFQDYIDGYTKKDVAMMRLALSRLKDFLKASARYRVLSDGLRPSQITRDMVRDFADYLKSRSRGEGAKAIYAHFKKVIKYAVEHDVMAKDPCSGIVIKADTTQIRKAFLSDEEIGRLLQTHYPNENNEVQRAFAFCLQTGLRWCDVRELTFAAVDYANKVLRFEQHKTEGRSARSGVATPLNDDIIGLIGEPTSPGNKWELIFKLPEKRTANNHLLRWVKAAGIDKHITWHCARHTFATNLVADGTDINTAVSLMGHSGLTQIMKYVNAIDTRKRQAIDRVTIPFDKLKTFCKK